MVTHDFDDVRRSTPASEEIKLLLEMRSKGGWELVAVAVLSDRVRHYWKRAEDAKPRPKKAAARAGAATP